MPDVVPKFPSIRKGGCRLKRLTVDLSFKIEFTAFNASSPLFNRAQKLLAHAALHPLCPLPWARRVSSDLRQASSRAGVFSRVKRLPGYMPHKCEMWRCPGSVSSKGSAHSCNLPSGAILG